MSRGKVCNCDERKKPIHERDWIILRYMSSINGYIERRSEYSTVCCKECGASWRTKADYVIHLDLLGDR